MLLKTAADEGIKIHYDKLGVSIFVQLLRHPIVIPILQTITSCRITCLSNLLKVRIFIVCCCKSRKSEHINALERDFLLPEIATLTRTQ